MTSTRLHRRARARQARALRDALWDERANARTEAFEPMLVPERRALGALEQHLSAEATRRFRASWRVGWHAGRLFALREGGAR